MVGWGNLVTIDKIKVASRLVEVKKKNEKKIERSVQNVIFWV